MLGGVKLWRLRRSLWKQEKCRLKAVHWKLALLLSLDLPHLMLINLCSSSSFLLNFWLGPSTSRSLHHSLKAACEVSIGDVGNACWWSIAVHCSLLSLSLAPPFSLSLSCSLHLFLSLSLFSHSVSAHRIQFHCSLHHNQTPMLVNKIDRQQRGMWVLPAEQLPAWVTVGWLHVMFFFWVFSG